jgi:hypothetical protein
MPRRLLTGALRRPARRFGMPCNLAPPSDSSGQRRQPAAASAVTVPLDPLDPVVGTTKSAGHLGEFPSPHAVGMTSARRGGEAYNYMVYSVLYGPGSV